MANEAKNKVIYNGDTLIDLTGDTITEADVINKKKFHRADGKIATGTCTYDADTSDATAVASEILNGKTAYKNGSKITGTMPNRGSVTSSIITVDQSVSIQNGYHDGGGSVSIDATEQAKIVAGNIKNGVEILGIEGTYTGAELIKATTKTATPSATAQTLLPSQEGDYDYFTQVTINAIPYTETPNAAGGLTVTIGQEGYNV